MKKVLAAVLSICMLFGLAACGSKGEKTSITVCEGNTMSVEVVNTLEAKGNKVIKQTMEMKTDIGSLGLSEDDIKDLLDQVAAVYDITGVSYDHSLDGNILTETVTIDFSKADLKELKEAELLDESSTGDEAFIGLKETVSAIEGQGFTCKLQ